MDKSGNTYPVQRRKAPESLEVKVDIQPGPAAPAQKAAWHKFWQKIIPEVKADDSR